MEGSGGFGEICSRICELACFHMDAAFLLRVGPLWLTKGMAAAEYPSKKDKPSSCSPRSS